MTKKVTVEILTQRYKDYDISTLIQIAEDNGATERQLQFVNKDRRKLSFLVWKSLKNTGNKIPPLKNRWKDLNSGVLDSSGSVRDSLDWIIKILQRFQGPRAFKEVRFWIYDFISNKDASIRFRIVPSGEVEIMALGTWPSGILDYVYNTLQLRRLDNPQKMSIDTMIKLLQTNSESVGTSPPRSSLLSNKVNVEAYTLNFERERGVFKNL